MTPEQLQKIRAENSEAQYRAVTAPEVAKQREHLSKVAKHIWPLLNYIDLLHEDLRITRAERDAEKHKNLALRKGQGAYRQENK